MLRAQEIRRLIRRIVDSSHTLIMDVWLYSIFRYCPLIVWDIPEKWGEWN
jgi:hypothetical protein